MFFGVDCVLQVGLGYKRHSRMTERRQDGVQFLCDDFLYSAEKSGDFFSADFADSSKVSAEKLDS